MNKNGPKIVAIGVLVCALVFGGIALTRNIGTSSKVVSKESAENQLAKYIKNIRPEQGTPTMGTITFDDADTTYQELPELTNSSIAVKPSTSVYAEIFASSEKTGTGSDGFLREMAEDFNRSGATLADGTKVSIQLRTVASGQQIDYVASGKYVPDAISPSSKMQVEMINAKGTPTEYVSESIVGNYAGIVVSSKTYSTLVEEYGSADVKSLAKAVADGKITMGYTNPFTSATGLNFLATLLDSYGDGNLSSEEAIEGFQSFQKNIPFVAMTTGQMRNAADKGTFDAFVSEYQAYVNDNTLVKNYKFIPFGYEHENPIAAIASISDNKKEILRLFVDYCEKNGASLAKKCGFNEKPEGYSYMKNTYTGQEIINAQTLYKENKDAKPVICVFVTDVSGSMDGAPLNSLKDSLVNAMQYINGDNYIGLVSYSNDVTIELPIGQFDLNQQSLFKGTVETLTANGPTATYDGVYVALDLIRQQLEVTPDAKAIVFLLSDGEQNVGNKLNREMIEGLTIPIYTICYNNGDSSAMKTLSEINEGASINATTDDVVYQLKQLFNANM